MSPQRPADGEPAASSISPLLGFRQINTALEHAVTGFNKIVSEAGRVADRFARMAEAHTGGGVGNPSTLGGGKPLGGGSTPTIGPRLNPSGSNGVGGKLPIPPISPLPQPGRMQPPPPATPAQKWGRYGAGVGAVWGTHAMQQFLSGADERLATNTTAQLMSRSSNMGAFQIRSLMTRDNTSAVSDTDAMQAGSTLSRSGYAVGTSGYNSLLNQTKNYNILDPTATAAQAASRLAAFGSVGTGNFLYSRGIRTVNSQGRLNNPNAVADKIIASTYKPGQKWNSTNIADSWGPGGKAQLLVNTVSGSMGADAGQMVSDRLHALQQASKGGMSASAFDTAVSKQDWNALSKAGFSRTDLDSLKQKEAAKRNVTDNTAEGFSKGLQGANDALTRFNEALDKVTQGNLGKLIGATQGVAGASGLASTLLQTGSGIAGSVLGGAIGARMGGGGIAGGIAGKALGGLGSKVAGTAAGKALGSAGSKVMGSAVGRTLGKVASKVGVKSLAKAGAFGIAADAAGALVSDGNHGVRDQFGAALSDAATGAMLGSFLGPVGAIVGGGAGAIYGLLANQPTEGQGGVAAEGNAGGPSVGGSKTGASTATSGIMPVSGFKVSAPFGHYSNGKPHHGVDFACPIGTPVRANRSGKVIKAGWDNGGFGNHVRIDSGDGLIEIYGHMSKVNVKAGDTVQAGQLLGLSGDTGNVTGPHLHFEVRKGGAGIGNAVDPTPYLNGSGGVTPGTPGDVASSVAAGANAQTTSSSAGQRGAGSGVPWGINEAELVAAGLDGTTGGPGPGGKPSGDSPSSGSTGAATTPTSGATGPLRAVLAKAGFTGGGLAMAYAIMMAESHGNAHAHNTNARTGDNSYGLFQINMLGGMGPERRAAYHLANNDALFDPLTNAKVAYEMSNHGSNWSPWSTYKRGDYKQYLGGQTKSYDVGSTNIDVDQIARVHKGEMIIDPVTADELRKALSSNTPTSILGSKGKGGGVHIDKIEITTAHSFTDSAATDLAKQTLAIIANHTNQQNLRAG